MQKQKRIAAIVAVGLVLGFASAWAAGDSAQPGKPEEKPQGHEAHHGGCLNAIDMCSVGHAEVKVEGDTLKLWFVGGENDTGTAVRVPDKEITLSVTPDQGKATDLVLKAVPNQLSEEEVGNCSHFEGAADWLKGVAKFEARGKVNFKGALRNIHVQYPDGYDPDEEPAASHASQAAPKASPVTSAPQGDAKTK